MPAGGRRLDGQGAIALPGLVDAHAHLDALPGAQGGPAVPRDDVVAAAGRQTLASGVTLVRAHLSGLTDGPPLAAASADPCTPLPRVVLGGPGLTGGAPDLNARLMRGIRNAADASAKVAEVAASGATWIAVHRLDAMSAEERRAIAGEARRRGLRVMASGDDLAELRAALALGVDTIEYLNRTDLPAYPDDVLAALRAVSRPLTVVAPIGYYTQYHAYRARPAEVRRPDLTLFYPPAAIAPVVDALEQQLRTAAPSPIDVSFPTLAAKFRQLRATGVAMALGSDSGSTAQFHIDAIWQEMRTWRELGVPADDVVRAGSIIAARAIGDPSRGRLDAGGPADLVLYRGDLTKTPFDRRHVHTVIKGGVVFVRDGKWVGP